MRHLIGFDPGGERKFGWCVVKDANQCPLAVCALGVADNAAAAVAAVFDFVNASGEAVAVGIDAPLFWTPAGVRLVDQTVRQRMQAHGAVQTHRTVQAVNSLRGACLVQGLFAALLSRQHAPGLPVTESHPKALLWLLGEASPDRPPVEISLLDLVHFQLPNNLNPTEHERDAALACLSAWAMLHEPPTWEDIYPLEVEPYSPIAEPLAYWIPCQP